MTWQDIDGWLTPAEGQALQALAFGGDVLELGAYKGRSTVCLAGVARRVVSVDHHLGDGDTGPADTLAAFAANLEAHGVYEKVGLLACPVEEAAGGLPAGHFDLVFVDTAHDAATVTRHTRVALQCVKPGGAVAWHDWDRESVRAGVRACGVAPRAVRGSLAWARF